jgi:hypothetical protein
MYSSLDKVDIVVEADDGVEVFVQTDHREASEIEAEPEVSTLFALTRAILPRSMGRAGVVRFGHAHAPPPLLRGVLAAAGAELDGDMAPMPPLDPSEATGTPAELADAAFAQLARRVMDREKMPLNAESVSAYALECFAMGFDQEEQEIGYWTAVAEIAALTGELLRQAHGGRWIDDEHSLATIPFVFQVGEGGHLANPAGKAEKVLDFGASEDPTQLLVSARDIADEVDEGTVMPNFKPGDWGGRDMALCEPLLENVDKLEEVSLPVITYGYDHPNSFGTMTEGDLRTVRPEAMTNLRHHEVVLEDHGFDGLQLLVAHDSYFAAEKVLDVPFMQRVHARLGPIVAVGIPKKGLLLATDASAADDMPRFMAILSGYHADAAPKEKLTPTPLLVTEGRVAGIVRLADDDEPPPEKKGFWGRLFGR